MSNSSGASSYDNSIEHESDEDFKVKLPVNIGMKLRERRIQGPVKYEEPSSENENSKEQHVEVKKSERIMKLRIERENKPQQNNFDQLEQEITQQSSNCIEDQEEQQTGVFYPEIDQILWKKLKQTSASAGSPLPQYEYLIKKKNYSYLHIEWMSDLELLQFGKGIKNKLNRFEKHFEQKKWEIEINGDDEDCYFDPTYTEVERILGTTDIFPIIHPKKSNELKGKWYELLATVVNKLLNFTKNNIYYGIFFMDPVNAEEQGLANYKKLISQPMDLRTILNRVYLGYYRSFQQFWLEMGLVFKNCRRYNKEKTCEIRILCDTLRELVIVLYQQWYKLQFEKYEELKEQYLKRLDKFKEEMMNSPPGDLTLEDVNKNVEILLEENEKQQEQFIIQISNLNMTDIDKKIEIQRQERMEKQKIKELEEQERQKKILEHQDQLEQLKKQQEHELQMNKIKIEEIRKARLQKKLDNSQKQMDQENQTVSQELYSIEDQIYQAIQLYESYNFKQRAVLQNMGQLPAIKQYIYQLSLLHRDAFHNQMDFKFDDQFMWEDIPIEEIEQILKLDNRQQIYDELVQKFCKQNAHYFRLQSQFKKRLSLLQDHPLFKELPISNNINNNTTTINTSSNNISNTSNNNLNNNTSNNLNNTNNIISLNMKQVRMEIETEKQIEQKQAYINEELNQKSAELKKSIVELQKQSQTSQQIEMKNSYQRAYQQRPKSNPYFDEFYTLEQIEQFNPGQSDLTWLLDERGNTLVPIESEERVYIDQIDIDQIDLLKEIDPLYFIKWRNLSYLECTWEPYSLICPCEGKLNDFRKFNRSFDKERVNLQKQMKNHHVLLTVLNEPKKKSKYSQAVLQQMNNELYHFNKTGKKPFIYTAKTQPVYKDRKLLRNYQLLSLNWLIKSFSENRNVILADEMGLGKTIQTIALLNHLLTFENMNGPFLVIAPLSTLEHWRRTVVEWTNLNAIVYYDVAGQEGRSLERDLEFFQTEVNMKGVCVAGKDMYKFHIMVTSYEVFLSDQLGFLQWIPFQYVVIDEAHRLKNQNAKILTNLKKIPCKRLLLLTGTPIQNNTEELWSLLNFIEPSQFNSLATFKECFGDLNTSEQITHLHDVLKPYLLRRMKEDVEASIPPLQETIINVEMTTIQKTLYRALYEKNKVALTRTLSGANFTSSLNNLEMQLRKCCNHPFLIKEFEAEITKDCVTETQKFEKMIESSGKMILLDKLLAKMQTEGKKVLIFSQFTQMLNLIEEYLKVKFWKYEKIDGSVKAKERQNAIDRFNDSKKQRDVFLLSTKAGGLGINLTSANIVVVFDSDWNPQNDIQAIARAHRIGQFNEVQVYRLVTSKTYEAEMFERSTKKQGLEQAIFMGGNFQTTEEQSKAQKLLNEDDKISKKISKQEIEMLLKKGILGLLNENENQRQSSAFVEENIDQILEKNSRIAQYSLINGTYKFSQSSFVSNLADSNININDPNFWQIVLQNQETESQKLIKELDENSDQLGDYTYQKHFMLRVGDLMSQFIETKLNIIGYSTDEEQNMLKILNKIYSMVKFHKQYRELVTTWLDEIDKPSRRFRKLALEDLEIHRNRQLVQKLHPVYYTNCEHHQADGDKIFSDSGEVDEEFGGNGSQNNKTTKASDKDYDLKLKKFCHFCEKQKCTFFCTGPCGRAFHKECKRVVEELGEIGGKDSNVINFEINEQHLDDEKIKKLMKEFLCKDCLEGTGICFICKQKGKFKKKTKSKKKNLNAAEIENLADEEEKQLMNSQLTKCSTANCHKFYHLSCLQQIPDVRYVDDQKTKFRCPLHYCSKCQVSGDAMPLIQCLRCTNSFHSKCLQKEKIVKLSKKVMVCQRHKQDWHQKQQYSSSKISLKLPSKMKIIEPGDKDPKELVIKMPKQKQSKLDDKLIITKQKNDRALRQKQNKEVKEEYPNNDFLEDQFLDEEELAQPIAKKSNKKKKKPIHLKKSNNFHKKMTKKFTYEELKIPEPTTFDYANYANDWCRYCGARVASNFTKGPWAPRTLCTIHYIEWGQKKKLNLSKYKALPSFPINLEANTELEFMSKIKIKNPDYYPHEKLEPQPQKKVRKGVENGEQGSDALLEANEEEIKENGQSNEVEQNIITLKLNETENIEQEQE